MFEKFIEAIDLSNRASKERDAANYWQGWRDCARYIKFMERGKGYIAGNPSGEQADGRYEDYD